MHLNLILLIIHQSIFYTLAFQMMRDEGGTIVSYYILFRKLLWVVQIRLFGLLIGRRLLVIYHTIERGRNGSRIKVEKCRDLRRRLIRLYLFLHVLRFVRLILLLVDGIVDL